VIATAGCFNSSHEFIKSSEINIKEVENDFALKVVKMLKKEGKLSDEAIENMGSWNHSGFNVYFSQIINKEDTESIENLARYLIRAPISQERMKYTSKNNSKDGKGKVVYTSKDGGKTEIIPGLEFLARLITHIPNKGEQLVRYCAYYSNKSRGLRKKENGESIEIKKICTKNASIGKKKFKRNWARLIQKIYNVDPLKCPKCQGQMKIKGFIEDEDTIRMVLKKLNLWRLKKSEPPSSPKDEIYTEENEDFFEKEEQEYYNQDSENSELEVLDIYTFENIDILPNYEDEVDYLPNYEECC
jgi:hypothetical protein